MKPKSMRLRFLKTLHAFWKHTDKDHRLNLKSLNNQFLPPELSFLSPRALSETLEAMREFGIDIRRAGRGAHDGIWIENRPLSDRDIYALNFAVSTNPYITEEMAASILQTLKPFVTVYQEPLLEVYVNKNSVGNLSADTIDIFGTIHKAARTKSSVRFRMLGVDPTDYSWVPKKTVGMPALFTPSRICVEDGLLCVIGYNHKLKKEDIVDLREIAQMTYEAPKKRNSR